MEYVAETPEFEESGYDRAFAEDYGSFPTLAELLRRIGQVRALV